MTVLMNLQIELEPGKAANLPIIENSTPKELAEKFVSDYDLNVSKVHPIAVYIHQQIQQLRSQPRDDIFANQVERREGKQTNKSQSPPQKSAFDRLSKFVSPKYELMDEDFEDFAPEKSVKFANPETFERLYNDAANRRRKIASSEPRASSSSIVHDPDYIYKKFTQLQKERDDRLEQIRRQKEAEEQEKEQEMLKTCSFKPGITEKGRNFRRDEDLYESLYKNTYIKARIEETKEMIQRATTVEETFSPNIDHNNKYYRRCSSEVQRDRKTRELGPYLAVELMPEEVKRIRRVQMQERMQYYQ